MQLSKIVQLMKDQPKIDIHEHLRPPELISPDKVILAPLIPMSYMGFYDFYPGLHHPRFDTSSPVIPKNQKDILEYIHEFPQRDIRECFIRGMSSVHNLNLNNAHIIASQIDTNLQQAYVDPHLYASSFSSLHIQQCICDIPYANLGYTINKQLGPCFLPQIQTRALLRINSLLFGFDPNAWNPNTDLIAFYCEHQLHIPRPTNFDDFLQIINKIIAWASKWCVGLKCASAYERTLDFGDPSKLPQLYDQNKKIYGRSINTLSEMEILQFGNYILAYILTENTKYRLPLQIHTGTAIESGSHPNHLKSVIDAFPDQPIELLHYGFPWVDAVTDLISQYPQVYSDFVWLPQLNAAILPKLVEDLTKRNLWSKIMAFGGDCACIEGSIGALLQLMDKLGSGFSQEQKNGLSTRGIEDIIQQIFYQTPKQFFHV